MGILRGMRLSLLLLDGDRVPGPIVGELAVRHLIGVEAGCIGDRDLLVILHLVEGVVESIIRGRICGIA